MTKMINCLHCGKETPQTKSNKKFCCTECRVYYWKEHRELATKKDVKAIMDKFDQIISQLKEVHG